MFFNQKVWIAKSDKNCYLLPALANRHGLIAGATGTGKTITMKVLAESFSDMGVPVFFSDVKGDLSGMCKPGIDTEDMRRRIEFFGIDGFEYKAYPTRFWDIFGEKGHPVRVTVSDMGPTLLARLFNLTDVQTGVLSIVFKVADDNGLELIDLKDLRAMLQYVGDNRAEFTTIYGNVSTASIGAIQRALLAFEEEGGINVFGEPDLDIRDWIRTDSDGRGYINILSSLRLIQSPTVYATFLLWMLTELFEKLPEVGDLDKPRMVFFFDEAHLLFDDAPKALVQKIVQVVKLIRSKGIGVYFVTQSPSDIPDEVLAQLSNRIQHGLRAYTPSELKAVRAAANAFRANPGFNSEEELKSLGTGEALVSFLDEKGIPTIVERAKILPPQSLMGPADEQTVMNNINSDEFELKYREDIDRQTAYEIITAAEKELAEQREKEAREAELEKQRLKEEKEAEKEAKKNSKSSKSTQSLFSKTAQRAATSAASSVGRQISTNVMNSAFGGKVSSPQTVMKRAATTALSSVMRTGATSIIRGLFGNKK
ncbi:MAG: DUF853 domain-containing protein [Clostridia bacterium]|nr:DUF853 domain-containing protein [Clostridia bacterium]